MAKRLQPWCFLQKDEREVRKRWRPAGGRAAEPRPSVPQELVFRAPTGFDDEEFEKPTKKSKGEGRARGQGSGSGVA